MNVEVRQNAQGGWELVVNGAVRRTYATKEDADLAASYLLEEPKTKTRNFQRAIDEIKALAGGIGSPLAKRAEDILSSLLQNSSEEAIGADFAQRNVDLLHRIILKARQQQDLADAGDALQVFRDEYNHVFIEPLKARRLLAPTAREQALIDTALEFAHADFTKRLNEYDRYLAGLGITEVNRSGLREAAMGYFATVVQGFIRQSLPELAEEAGVPDIEATIRDTYLARAGVVRAEGQARSAFRSRLSTMTSTLDKMRNDAGFSEDERRAFTQALEAIVRGEGRAEEEWIVGGGTVSLEDSINGLVTRELQAATLQSPDLFGRIVAGDAVGTLGALIGLPQERAGQEKARTLQEAKTVVAATRARLEAEAFQRRAVALTPGGLDPMLTDPAFLANVQSMATQLSLTPDEVYGMFVQQGQQRKKTAEQVARDRQTAEIINQQAQAATARGEVPAGVPGSILVARNFAPKGFIAGGTPTGGKTLEQMIAESARFKSVFGENVTQGVQQLQKAGFLSTMPEAQQASIAESVVQAEIERQKQEQTVRAQTEATGLTVGEAKELEKAKTFVANPAAFGATEAPTVQELQGVQRRIEELEAKKSVAPPASPPSLALPSRQRRGIPAVRV